MNSRLLEGRTVFFGRGDDNDEDMPPPLPEQDYGLDQNNDLFASNDNATIGYEQDEPLGAAVQLDHDFDNEVDDIGDDPTGAGNHIMVEEEPAVLATARKRGRPSLSNSASRNVTPAKMPAKTDGGQSKPPCSTVNARASDKKRKAVDAVDGAPLVKKTRVSKPLKAERAPERIQSRRVAAEAAKATFSTALKKAKIVESSDPAPKRRKAKARAERVVPVPVSSEAYEVEEVLDSGVDAETKKLMYLVKWKGYTSKHNTWEPKKNLSGASELIKQFNANSKAENPGSKKAPGRKPRASTTTKGTPGRKPSTSKPGRKPAAAKASTKTATKVASVPAERQSRRNPRAAHGK